MVRFVFHSIMLFLSLYSFQKVFSLHPMSILSVGLVVACLLLYKKAAQASKRTREFANILFQKIYDIVIQIHSAQSDKCIYQSSYL